MRSRICWRAARRTLRMSRSLAVSRSASAWKLSAIRVSSLPGRPSCVGCRFLLALGMCGMRELGERLDHLAAETARREQGQHQAEDEYERRLQQMALGHAPRGRRGDQQAELAGETGGRAARAALTNVSFCRRSASSRLRSYQVARSAVRAGVLSKETTSFGSGAFRSKVQSTSPVGSCSVAAITRECACTPASTVAAAEFFVVLKDRGRDLCHGGIATGRNSPRSRRSQRRAGRAGSSA